MRTRDVTALAVALIIVALAAPSASWAVDMGSNVDLDLSGYYRVRYDNIFNTGWYFDEDSDWWGYMDQRMKLNPVLSIYDNISINMQLDLLRNSLFGQNLVARVPVIEVVRDEDDEDVVESFRLGSYDLSKGNILSQDTSVTTRSGDEIPSIIVTRLWGQVTTPIGQLRLGRQGSQFGLGLFSNAGDGYDSDNGDTYDRLMWLLKVGPVVPVLGYDRVAEADFKTGTNDVHQFFMVINYLSDKFKTGIYFVHRNQASTNARVFIYDLWMQGMISKLTLEGEAVILQGSMTQVPRDVVTDLEEEGLPVGEGGGKIEIDAYIAAAKVHWDDSFWGSGAEYGFSSPSDPNPDREWDPAAAAAVSEAKKILDADEDDPRHQIDFINVVVNNQAAFGKKVYTFPFDADYEVDLILWEEIFGAVSNGMYAKINGYLKLASLKFQVDLLYSWINESGKGLDGKDAAHDLGFEMDYDISYTMYEHFTMSLQFGYFFPGQYFEDSYEGVEDLYTIQTNFVFHF